jgi:hypothetical protein
VCPEYFILVPSLLPAEWPWHYLEGNYNSTGSTTRGPVAVTQIRKKRKRHDMDTTTDPDDPLAGTQRRRPIEDDNPSRGSTTLRHADGQGTAAGTLSSDRAHHDSATNRAASSHEAHGTMGPYSKQPERLTNKAIVGKNERRVHLNGANATLQPMAYTAPGSDKRQMGAGGWLEIAAVTPDNAGEHGSAAAETDSVEALQAKAEILRLTAFLKDPDYWKSRYEDDREYNLKLLAVREKEAEAAKITAEALLMSAKEKRTT